MTHDPLCTYGPEWDRMKGSAKGCPECALIARVRADERVAITDILSDQAQDAVAAALAAAEPLIRADERAKAPVHSTGTDTGGPCCECCYEVNYGDGWRRDRRVMREVRHHAAEALATEMAARLVDDDGRAYIALDEAQRIARGTP